MFLGSGPPVCGRDIDDCDGGGAWVCRGWFIECLVVDGEFEERMALACGRGGLGLLLWLLLLLLGYVCVGFGCWDLYVRTGY
jgi:hypothetical protein